MAQDNIFMFDGTVEACEGSFQDDSGGSGAEGAPYSDQDYVFTICPDIPGDVISVDFVAFNLQTSPNYPNSDFLTIYDGDNTGEPSLGSYTGGDLQGLAVTGTINNTSGCLTFAFNVQTGNTNSMPGWEGLISCTTPCDPPQSMSEITNPVPEIDTLQTVGVCIGDPVTFEDVGSTAGSGFSLETWYWDFGDGIIDSLSGTQVTHSFDEPGEYLVTLTVKDNNGCYSLNLDPLQVLVSTVPIFNTDFDPIVCLGGEGSADGSPLENVTWTALPPQVVAGETYLADGAGFSYSSSLTFDFFEPGAELEDCEDLLAVNVNMEHSYLGDLLIQIECPDGTTVTLLDWPNNGGGCFLGEAVDDGTTVPGTGYDYGWAPGQTNGNLDNQDNWTQQSYTDNNGNAENNNVVDAGLYESEEDLCNLVGCPLNGTWTFTIVDNLAIDNGYIFEWGLDFNPYLYPDVTTFTPIVGMGSDSSWWEGPFITSVSDDGNAITFDVPDLGTYDYTYTVINNFGCNLDTTITIECVPGPVVDAGEDDTFCGDLQLEAVIVSNEFPSPPCEFVIEMFNDEFGFGWDGASIDVLVDGNFIGNYTTFGTTDQPISIESGQTLTINYFASLWGTTGQEFNIYDDDGNLIFESGANPTEGEVYSETITCVGEGQIVYEWEPPEGLSDPNSPNPQIDQVSGETEYTVTAYPSGFPGCASSDVVTISPAFVFDVTFQNPSCAGNDGFVHVFIDGNTGTPPWDIEFYEGGVLQGSIQSQGGTEEFNDLLPGDYQVVIINNQCTYEIDTPIEQPDIIVIETNPDSTICIGGTAFLSAWSAQDVDDSWTYIWDNSLGSGMDVVDQPSETTTYSVYAIDDFGCESAEYTVTVDIYPELSLEIFNDSLVCQGTVATLGAESFNGGNGGPYTFDWYNGASLIGSGETLDITPNTNGEYCVTLSDGCETPEVEDCMIIDIEVAITVEIASDTTQGCAPADIVFQVPIDSSLYDLAQWTISDGTFIFNANQFGHEFEDPGSYDVSLLLVSTIGCEYSGTFNNYISIFEDPVAGFTAEPQPTVIPETEISFFDESIGSVVNWFWIFDPFSPDGVAFEQNPIYKFPYDVPGTYPVELIVTDINGCQDSVIREIVIDDLLNFYIPNSFTPNGDGINDVLSIEGTDIDPNRFRFQVFNRWGDIVYETDDVNFNWTGGYNDGEYYIQDEVYSWRCVVYSLTRVERYEFVGHVTIIR